MEESDRYKKVLDEERVKLENELNALGKPDPKDPLNWDLSVPQLDIMQADENELADLAEESHIDSIVLDELEARHRLVTRALRKLEEGTFGRCEVCDGAIEAERLLANAAARTCKSHLAQEDALPL